MSNTITGFFELDKKETKLDRDKGIIKGTMTRFGIRSNDYRNIMLMPGSLDEWLEKNDKLTMKFVHSQLDIIGKWTEMKADEERMTGVGKLTLDVPKAKEAMALIKDDVLTALSVTFFVDDYSKDIEFLDDEYETLVVHKAGLKECSPVPDPAMLGSEIEEYMSAEDKPKVKPHDNYLRYLLKAEGLSRSQIKYVLQMREKEEEQVKQKEIEEISLEQALLNRLNK